MREVVLFRPVLSQVDGHKFTKIIGTSVSLYFRPRNLDLKRS